MRTAPASPRTTRRTSRTSAGWGTLARHTRPGGTSWKSPADSNTSDWLCRSAPRLSTTDNDHAPVATLPPPGASGGCGLLAMPMIVAVPSGATLPTMARLRTPTASSASSPQQASASSFPLRVVRGLQVHDGFLVVVVGQGGRATVGHQVGVAGVARDELVEPRMPTACRAQPAVGVRIVVVQEGNVIPACAGGTCNYLILNEFSLEKSAVTTSCTFSGTRMGSKEGGAKRSASGSVPSCAAAPAADAH